MEVHGQALIAADGDLEGSPRFPTVSTHPAYALSGTQTPNTKPVPKTLISGSSCRGLPPCNGVVRSSSEVAAGFRTELPVPSDASTLAWRTVARVGPHLSPRCRRMPQNSNSFVRMNVIAGDQPGFSAPGRKPYVQGWQMGLPH